MGGARKDTRANLDLIAELEAMGVHGVTSRKLERWRQVGAAPEVEQLSRGRAGTVTRWAPGTAHQIEVLVRLLNRRVPLRDCPLALFHLGFSVDRQVLSSRYLEMYRGFTQTLEKVAPTAASESDPLDRSDMIARAVAQRAGRGSMTRRWERRVRQSRHVRGSEAIASVRDVLSVGLAGVVAGETPTTEGAAELLRAAGLDDGQDPGEVAEVLSRLQVDGLVDAIQKASQEDWERARTATEALFELMRLRRSAEVILLGPGSGLPGLDDFTSRYDDPLFVSQLELTPVFLVLASPQWLHALHDQLAAFRAVARLMTDLPADLRRFLGPAGARALESSTQEERTEVEKRMVEWLHHNRDVAESLNKWIGDS